MHDAKLRPPATEAQDWAVGTLAKVAAGLIVVLALCAVVVGFLFPGADRQRLVQPSLPAAAPPALQSSPRNDMATFYAQEMRQLHSAGWVDRARGVVHMPIDEAMRKVARDGIKNWPGAAK